MEHMMMYDEFILHGLVKVWNGSSWVEKQMKYWTGSEWVQKPLKYWDGSNWSYNT